MSSSQYSAFCAAELKAVVAPGILVDCTHHNLGRHRPLARYAMLRARRGSEIADYPDRKADSQRLASRVKRAFTWSHNDGVKFPLRAGDEMSTAGHILESGSSSLFYTYWSQGPMKSPDTAILNLSALNRVFMHAAQLKLAQRTHEILESPKKVFDDTVNDMALLDQYCEPSPPFFYTSADILEGKAAKNMEYMQSCNKRGPDDPFRVTTDTRIEREILLQSGLIGEDMADLNWPLPADDKRPKLVGTSRAGADSQMRFLRLAYALAGGIGLLAPMLIMVYVPGTTASVATTCAFMVLFALGLALWSDAQPREILTISAAYAAVLVVFVGVRVQPSVG